MTTPLYEMGAALMLNECEEKLQAAVTIEDKLRQVFRVAKDHWMIPDDENRFKSALGAMLMHLKGGDDYDRLSRSITALGKLSATLHALKVGLPIDIEQVLEQQRADNPNDDLIPLNKIWHEVREE
jgi:hypothetical protein